MKWLNVQVQIKGLLECCVSKHTNIHSADAHWCMRILEEENQTAAAEKQNPLDQDPLKMPWVAPGKALCLAAGNLSTARLDLWKRSHMESHVVQLSLLAAMIQSGGEGGCELDMLVHRVPSLLISIYAFFMGNSSNQRYLPEANEASYISTVNHTALWPHCSYIHCRGTCELQPTALLLWSSCVRLQGKLPV